MAKEKVAKEPLFHIVKRDKMPMWQGLLIRAGAIAAALVLCLLFSFIVVGVTPDVLISSFFKGNFGSERRIFILLKDISVLLLIALALTPAFRMRFWNIGAEGQVLVGALAAVSCAYYLGGKINEFLLLALMFVAAIVAGAVWGFIPALFKAIWNANETLFTLMMNYIATCLVSYMLAAQFASASNSLPELKFGHLNFIPSWSYGDEVTVVIFAVVITVMMYIYLRYSKHGYEISVVGESENTARYIGISVKKVVIRTMIISGALCGLVGFLIVAVFDHSITTNTAGGQGFTAIMVSWLGKFNPFIMSGVAFIISFLNNGADQLVTSLSSKGISPDLPDVIVGTILFFIVGCEFFINYSIKFRTAKGGNK
ncbi:MAG: ABC transporter permease [Clostridia bacterium]|nr:ABC transporter permease [Clostridia bacterium]